MSEETEESRFWRDVEAAFSAVLEAGESGRGEALDRHCRGDAGLRREVEALLGAHIEAGDFIEPGPPGRLARLLDDTTPDVDAVTGARIGAFRIERRLGEGGMGAVYLAERDIGGFAQRVAVKLIASRLYGADTLRRFVAERQILATLQHPHIVSLLDGGLTPTGHPYIAMEYVDGVTITGFSKERSLDVFARLRLFTQLCAAVAFAHRHLVVHRDLKPSNVLVTAEGQVKVLDFGVAKLLEPQRPSADATGALLAPVTPDYASPEQLRGEAVTTACDVYALGVILYELLAGRRPYATAGKSLDEVFAVVLHHEPPRPSAAAAESAPRDVRRLRGDLDAIVSRAMAKDTRERYLSVEELAADVQRHLDGRPVLARPPSLRYRAGKAAARHKTAFAAGGVLGLLLLAAVGGALWQGRVAARERLRAERRFHLTENLSYALLGRINDALVGLQGSTQARQIIVDEARVYLQALSEDRGEDDELALKLGQAYRELGTVQGYPGIPNLGDVPGAILSYHRGIALVDPLLDRKEPPLLAFYESSTLWARLSHTLASMPRRRGDAEQAARRSLDVADALAAREPGSDQTLRALADASIMVAYAVEPASAGAYWQAALDHHLALLANLPDDPDRIVMAALMQTNRAAHLEAQLDPQAARPHHEGARTLYTSLLASGRRTRFGDEARATILGNLGVASIPLGDARGARRILEESLAMRLDIARRDEANANAWPRVALGHAELARACEAAGDDVAALRHAQEALAAFARRPPEPKLVATRAETHLRIGRLEARGGHSAAACAAMAQAQADLDAIAAAGRITPQQQAWAAEARRGHCPP